MLRIRSILALAGVTVGVLASSSAFADEGRQSGLELGLRTGYGIPMGKTVDSDADAAKLSYGFNGQIPIWLDVGYRINPNIYAGAYFSYGIALINSDHCQDCSGSDMRFGVNAHYHIMPDHDFDPWVGLGIGYEILGFTTKTNGVSTDGSYKGLEFLNLQVGGDYKLAPNLTVGPFVAFSLGQYSTLKVGDVSTDIDKKAMHEWLTLGVRGTFGL